MSSNDALRAQVEGGTVDEQVRYQLRTAGGFIGAVALRDRLHSSCAVIEVIASLRKHVFAGVVEEQQHPQQRILYRWIGRADGTLSPTEQRKLSEWTAPSAPTPAPPKVAEAPKPSAAPQQPIAAAPSRTFMSDQVLDILKSSSVGLRASQVWKKFGDPNPSPDGVSGLLEKMAAEGAVVKYGSGFFGLKLPEAKKPQPPAAASPQPEPTPAPRLSVVTPIRAEPKPPLDMELIEIARGVLPETVAVALTAETKLGHTVRLRLLNLSEYILEAAP